MSEKLKPHSMRAPKRSVYASTKYSFPFSATSNLHAVFRKRMEALAALKAEIAKKRASTSKTDSAADRTARKLARKWRTKAEIEKEREAAYRAEENARERESQQRKKRKFEEKLGTAHSKGQSVSSNRVAEHGNEGESVEQRDDNAKPAAEQRENKGSPPLEKREVCKRLRAMKEPVTLFGESPWGRFERLRNLELEREEGTEGQRNVFQTKLREMQAKEAEEEIYQYAGARMPHLETKDEDPARSLLDEKLQENDSTCKEDIVYVHIRHYMRLWRSEIDDLSPEDRKTMRGRSLIVSHEQTKEWLHPLERLLRKKKLSRNILDALKAIFHAAERGDFLRANTLYLERLAIGNAPWPMGATMVGIHARAAREKIGEDKVAHVMNDEPTRKFIQATKRLLTVAERHHIGDLLK